MKKNKKDLMLKLIYLSLITTSIVTVMSLSKFQSTTNTNSSAKVAVYAMNAYAKETNTDLKIDSVGEDNIKAIDSCSYVITNERNGETTEVAVSYKIKVDFEEELPIGITFEVIDEDGNKGNPTTTNNSYIFENEQWKFEPGEPQTNNVTINFIGENKENATSTTLSNVKVSVIVEQID